MDYIRFIALMTSLIFKTLEYHARLVKLQALKFSLNDYQMILLLYDTFVVANTPINVLLCLQNV